MLKQFFSTLVCILALSVSQTALSGNIDLSTLPQRDSIQLTIYNSEDLTLVQETRTMSFKTGTNKLQFSWANTLIDPTSVELRFLQKQDQLHIQQTSFPHDRHQMLYWTVNSQVDGQVSVEISYFTSGITWSADYVGVATAQETHLDLESFVRVRNQSGENYENARIRLVVGSINLVDKIAALSLDPKKPVRREKRQRHMLKKMMAMPAAAPMMKMKGSSRATMQHETPKAIAKSGLSEYYIYAIEGQESISNGWSKRMTSFNAKHIPITVKYRYRPREYGHHLAKLFLFDNTIKAHLGTTPMPKGAVRLFKRNQQSLEYLAQLQMKYVPLGDKVTLNLGQDPEIMFEEIKLQTWRDNVWMRYRKGQVHRRLHDKKIKVNHQAHVSGWHDHTLYNQRIRNFSNRDIDVEWRKPYPGDSIYSSQLNPSLHDYKTVEVNTKVSAQSTQNNLFVLTTKQGKNHKQDQVTLKAADIPYPDFSITLKR